MEKVFHWKVFVAPTLLLEAKNDISRLNLNNKHRERHGYTPGCLTTKKKTLNISISLTTTTKRIDLVNGHESNQSIN